MTDLAKTEPAPEERPGGLEVPEQRPSAMHRSALFARRAELEAAAEDVHAPEFGQ